MDRRCIALGLLLLLVLYVILSIVLHFTQPLRCPSCKVPNPLPDCEFSLETLLDSQTTDKVQTEGYLATSLLEFCSRNPFVKILKNEKDGSAGQAFWESEKKVESFFRTTYFNSGCHARYAESHRRFDSLKETIQCSNSKRLTILLIIN